MPRVRRRDRALEALPLLVPLGVWLGPASTDRGVLRWWDLAAVLGWYVVRMLLRRAHLPRGVVDAAWTLNPLLLLGALVLPSRSAVAVVAATLAVGALVLAHRLPLRCGLLLGVALVLDPSTVVAALGLLLVWAGRAPRGGVRRAGWAVIGAAASAGALSLWSGWRAWLPSPAPSVPLVALLLLGAAFVVVAVLRRRGVDRRLRFVDEAGRGTIALGTVLALGLALVEPLRWGAPLRAVDVLVWACVPLLLAAVEDSRPVVTG